MSLRKKPLCSLVAKSTTQPLEPLHWLGVNFQLAEVPDAVVGLRKSADVLCCPSCHAKLYFGVAKPS